MLPRDLRLTFHAIYTIKIKTFVSEHASAFLILYKNFNICLILTVNYLCRCASTIFYRKKNSKLCSGWTSLNIYQMKCVLLMHTWKQFSIYPGETFGNSSHIIYILNKFTNTQSVGTEYHFRLTASFYFKYSELSIQSLHITFTRCVHIFQIQKEFRWNVRLFFSFFKYMKIP